MVLQEAAGLLLCNMAELPFYRPAIRQAEPVGAVIALIKAGCLEVRQQSVSLRCNKSQGLDTMGLPYLIHQLVGELVAVHQPSFVVSGCIVLGIYAGSPLCFFSAAITPKAGFVGARMSVACVCAG